MKGDKIEMENKIVNLDALDKIAKELRRKSLVDINQQGEEIEKVRDMFGGKSFRYVLQEEYDNLSEEEKNDPGIVWNIIDAEEPISKEYVDNINDNLQESINNINDLKADRSELFSGDYNDLTNKPEIPPIDDLINNTFDSLATEDKTLIGAINELALNVFQSVSKVIELDLYKVDKDDIDSIINEHLSSAISKDDTRKMIMDIFNIDIDETK